MDKRVTGDISDLPCLCCLLPASCVTASAGVALAMPGTEVCEGAAFLPRCSSAGEGKEDQEP